LKFKTNKPYSIFVILFLALWLPGYFDLFSPYAEGSYQSLPYWLNIIVAIVVIFLIIILIVEFSFFLEINDIGITEKTFKRRTIKWQDISGWGYSIDTSDEVYLFLELLPDKKQKIIYSPLVHKKNLPLIKSELEKRIGQPAVINDLKKQKMKPRTAYILIISVFVIGLLFLFREQVWDYFFAAVTVRDKQVICKENECDVTFIVINRSSVDRTQEYYVGVWPKSDSEKDSEWHGELGYSQAKVNLKQHETKQCKVHVKLTRPRVPEGEYALVQKAW